VNDRRAVVVLCPLAHRVHVSDSDKLSHMVVAGQELPTIDERHTLWVKQVFDPQYYDEEFLASIWIGIPPKPERPPEYWAEQMYNNQGIIY
jgi:hypothetical protein